jgi:protease YdgD
VLTQARCLYAEREGRWFKPFELHVIAAYQRDSFLADSKVADFTAAPGFNPQAGSSLANLASNWALITLQEPIGQRTGWLGLQWDSAGLQAAARAGTAAYLRAGYRYDRPHAVSLHFGCSEAADSAARLCQATPAELSLPPFVIADGELRVLADFYATTPSQGSALARLSGATISGGRLGAAQPPSRDSLAGRQPTATAAQLLAALGYDTAGGDIGGAAAAFRRDNGLPAGEAIDLPLLAALLNAAWRSGR